MVLSQTLIVASTSTVVLVVMSAVSVYLYADYARPETSDPKAYEETLSKKLKNINGALKELEKSNDNSALAKVIQRGDKKLPVTLEEGITRPVSDDPVKILFKSIYSTAAKIEKEAKKNDDANNDSSNIIERIQFPSELGKTQALLHELSTDKTDPTSIVSNEVIISQVGLSLRRPDMFAAVYKIQNVFNTPGKVGHLFVMEGFKDIKTPFKLNLKRFNLLNKTPESIKVHIVNESDFYDLQVVTNYEGLLETLAKNAKLEEKSEKPPHLNPYKWLNMALFLTGHLGPGELAYVLLTPKHTNSQIRIPIYPEDVEAISLDVIQGDKIDSALYSGDATRIFNHCKDYLPEASLTEL